MRRYVLLIVRLLIAAAGIGYILWAITWRDHVVDGELRPGVLTILEQANVAWLVGGLVLLGLSPPGQALRWWLLLRCRGVIVGYRRAFRLTMLGLFFNFCMPGMTGGDLVKAYYAAKGNQQRGAAIMSIVFDRVSGLIALILLAAVAGLTMLDHELARRVTFTAWAMLGAGAVGALVYFSPLLRRAVGWHHVLARLDERNWVRRIDAAAVAYHHHLPTLALTVALSVVLHVVMITATALAGYALGVSTPMTLMLVVLPVVLAAGAMPLTYQGLGVMEAVAVALLVRDQMATINQVVAMLVMLRMYMIVYGLLGSLGLLRKDISLTQTRGAV